MLVWFCHLENQIWKGEPAHSGMKQHFLSQPNTVSLVPREVLALSVVSPKNHFNQPSDGDVEMHCLQSQQTDNWRIFCGAIGGGRSSQQSLLREKKSRSEKHTVFSFLRFFFSGPLDHFAQVNRPTELLQWAEDLPIPTLRNSPPSSPRGPTSSLPPQNLLTRCPISNHHHLSRPIPVPLRLTLLINLRLHRRQQLRLVLEWHSRCCRRRRRRQWPVRFWEPCLGLDRGADCSSGRC